MINILRMPITGNFPPNTGCMKPRFPKRRTRRGPVSVPYLDLDPGTYLITFVKESGAKRTYKLKTWISPFGWAYELNAVKPQPDGKPTPQLVNDLLRELK